MAALNVPDFRNWSQPAARYAQAMDNVTPIVATLAAYGEQVGSQWVYNQRPRQSRYLGGTAQGGFVMLPPEVGIDSFGDTFQPTNIGTLSKPYFTMGPGARLGFGPPDLTDGTVDGGWSMSWFLNSETNLDPGSLLRGGDFCLWQHASAASPAFAIFSDSQTATLRENIGWKSNTDFWGVFDHANTANRLYTFPDADTTIHGGSGTANRLAYWSAATTLAANAAIASTRVLYADANGLPQGSANLTFDNITLTVAQSLRVGTASEVLAQGDAVFGLTTADRIFYQQSTNIFEHFETSTSDPVYRFTLAGANSYALGIDNSDSDKFKVSYGSAGNAVLGTNDLIDFLANTDIVINEGGLDLNVRVEGDNKQSLLTSDGGNDEIAVSGRFSLRAGSPSQITADQNDYAGPETAATGRVSTWIIQSDASRTLTGIAGGLDGRIIILTNDGSFNIVLAHQNAGSAAGNRIITQDGASVTITPDDTCIIQYDNGASRWRVIVNPISTGSSVSAATQAEQEAGSSTTVYTSPGRQQYHASAAKAWVKFNGQGTVAISVSYNVTSITDNGTGDYTINLTTAFSSADYAVAAIFWFLGGTDGVFRGGVDTASTSSTIRVGVNNQADTLAADPRQVTLAAYGDQ